MIEKQKKIIWLFNGVCIYGKWYCANDWDKYMIVLLWKQKNSMLMQEA